MTATYQFRQSSIFEWAPKPILLKPWETREYVTPRIVVEKMIANRGKIPEQSSDLCPYYLYFVESNRWMETFYQKDIRIRHPGSWDLYTMVRIEDGDVSEWIYDHSVPRTEKGCLKMIDTMEIDGQVCHIVAEGKHFDVRLAEPDISIGDMEDLRRYKDMLSDHERYASDREVCYVALDALNEGADRIAVRDLASGPVNLDIYNSTINESPRAMDLAL